MYKIDRRGGPKIVHYRTDPYYPNPFIDHPGLEGMLQILPLYLRVIVRSEMMQFLNENCG